MFKELLDDPNYIVYEDDALLVVNKPAGMLVHPTVRQERDALTSLVERYYLAIDYWCNAHLLLRLDRNTSGLVLFAKSPEYQNIIMRSKPRKEYLAIVTGNLPQAEGIIDAPLGRREGSIIERCVRPDGKKARTGYKILRRSGELTLVQLRLFTGRTHQIRVHLASVGCPVLHDTLYGKPGPRLRQALHAFKLGLTHPVTGRDLEITSGLPDDLHALLERGRA